MICNSLPRPKKDLQHFGLEIWHLLTGASFSVLYEEVQTHLHTIWSRARVVQKRLSRPRCRVGRGLGPRNHAVDDEPTEMPCGPRFACGLYYYHHYYYYHHHHYTSGVHVSRILKKGPRVERRRRAGQGTEGWVQEGSPSRWGRGLGCPLPRNFVLSF